jgi:uncharacterized membrane protein
MTDPRPLPVPPAPQLGASHPPVPTPRAVDAARGLAWLAEGWTLFRRAPLIWVAVSVVMTVGFLIIAWIPAVGQLAITLLSVLFAGGLMLGCRALDRGEELTLGHLFAGIQGYLSPLLVVGALYVAGVFLLLVTVSLLSGGAALAVLRSGLEAGSAVMSILLALLAAGVVLIPLGMATWFAPALVTLDQMAPVEAMKLSFRGCLRNVLPFLVYGVLCLVLALLASIPAGLGWLVFLPVLAASVYAGHKDIFASR